MTESNQLLIRWDDAYHHAAVFTSPYHQHVGSEENVQPSEPTTLKAVLTFVARQLVISD